MESFASTVDSKSLKNWWLFPLVGVLLIALSFWIIRTPAESLLTLAIMFSIVILFKGITGIFYSISNRKVLANWGWNLIGGIFDLFIGTFLILNAQITPLIFTFVITFWILFRGIMLISASIDLKKAGVKTWGWTLILGILICGVAFGLFWNPVLRGLIVIYMIAFSILMLGVQHVLIGFGIRRIGKAVDTDS